MSKAAWVALLILGPCAAFTVGLTVGALKSGKPGRLRPQRVGEGSDDTQRGDGASALRSTNEKLRKELATKERRIAALQIEIREVRENLFPPLSPEEEKRWRDYQETQRKKRRREATLEKSKELRGKILQRKDKALRQQALAELAALFQTDDAEKLMLGLRTLAGLADYISERETFKPYVLAALDHEDSEVRYAAFSCSRSVLSWEENADIHLSMTNDRSPEIRELAAALLWQYLGIRNERDEKVATVLTGILRDGDASVKKAVLSALSSGYDYGGEMEDLVVELSRDPETREAAHQWLSEVKTIDAKVAQRLIELFDEGQGVGWTYGTEWMRKSFTEDAKPIVSRFCVDVVRDNIGNFARLEALRCLSNIGEVSALPELEAIAQGPRAQGIEEELSRTIGRLRGMLEEQQR